MPKHSTNLVKFSKGQDRQDESVAKFERAAALAPDDPGMHTDLGAALRTRGQITEAIGRYEHALSIDPEFGLAYYSLGNALSEYGKIAEAEEAYQQAVQRLPDDASAFNNLGHVLIEFGRKAEAETALRTAIDPHRASAHFNLHAVVYRDDDLDPAIASLEAALATSTDDGKSQFFHAMCLEQKGDKDAAIASFDKVPLDDMDTIIGLTAGTMLCARSNKTPQSEYSARARKPTRMRKTRRQSTG